MGGSACVSVEHWDNSGPLQWYSWYSPEGATNSRGDKIIKNNVDPFCQDSSHLVLVRYLIPTIFIDTWIWFDTRYSILDTFVVNVISSTYSGATWNDCAMSIYYFSKNLFFYEIFRGKRNPDFFSRKSNFFPKTWNSGVVLCYKLYYFSKT